MAATGFTPVFIYSSSTGGNSPAAANLTNTTLGSELAINITDGYLFYKDNANAIQKIGIKNPATTSGTLAQFASTTSAQLAGVISDETGSGSLVFATSPTLTTPNIGAATGTSLVTGNITYNSTGATSTGRLTLTPASGDYVLIDGGTDDAYKLRIANDELAWLAGAYGTGSTYPREFVMTSARLDSGSLPILRIGGQGGIKFAVDVNTVRGEFDTSGNLTLNTGNLVIGTSGKGIDFSATAGTGTSELLADYEEGTFTPAVYGTTSAGTATYANQYGRYTKVGDTVRFTIYLNWGSHTGTGNMRISGLPYTPNSNASEFSIPATWCNNLTLTAGNIVVCQVAPGDTNLYVVQNPTGGGASSAVAMDAGASMVITGTYRVN